jgi:hypothetical protein
MVKKLKESPRRTYVAQSLRNSGLTLGLLAQLTATNEKVRIYDKTSEDMIADGEYFKDVLKNTPELMDVEVEYLSASGSKSLWIEVTV